MLEILAKQHDEWITMGIRIGIPSSLVEDFVHEMYLRINKYIKDSEKIKFSENEINKMYVFVTLRNLWLDYKKKNSKLKVLSIDNFINDENSRFDSLFVDKESDVSFMFAEQKIIDKINKIVDSWDSWYDKKLFDLYFRTDMSMRMLSKETSISLISIFNSCKKYKKIIKDELGEDYQDFLNKDYDKIK